MKQAILIIGVVLSISSSAFAGYDANAIEGGKTWLEEKQDKVNHGWERFYPSYTNGRAVRAFLAYEEAVSEPNTLLMEKYNPVRDRLLQLQATNGSWDNDIYNTCNAVWALMEDPSQSPDANEIKRAVQWLKDRQQSDGSWDDKYYNNSLAIIALIMAGESLDSDAVEDGVTWLKETHIYNEYWGIPPNSVSGLIAQEAEPVIALCMANDANSNEVNDAVDWLYNNVDDSSVTWHKVIALRAFAYATNAGLDYEEERNGAITWVLDAQNDDIYGGWNFGTKDFEPSHSVATSNAIIALADANHNGVELKEGLEYICSEITGDGTVEGDYELVDATEWAIAGLGINGESETNVSVAMSALEEFQSNVTILDCSNAGSWRDDALVIETSWVYPGIIPAGLFLWVSSNSGLAPNYPDPIEKAQNLLNCTCNYSIDNGWPYLGTDPRSESAMDPTLYALIGLHSTDEDYNVIYLKNNRTDLDNTWRNALAVMIFDLADPVYQPGIDLTVEKELSISWLRDNQNPDGGWGHLPGETSVVDDTSMALIALSTVGDPNDPNLTKGAAWLTAAGKTPDDGGWSNAPGSPASNTKSTALAIWALALIPPAPLSVTITTDKEEYCPGETVEITVQLSEPVCDIVGYVTDCNGQVIPLFLELQDPCDPCNYIDYYNIPTSSKHCTYTINVDGTTCDDRSGFGVKTFDVLMCFPQLLMREPWVMDSDVHTGPGIEELRLFWSESLLFSDADITVTNEDGNSVPFDSLEWPRHQNVMVIDFNDIFLNDKYTITIADTVVSKTTGYAIDGDNNGIEGGDAILVMEHRERHDSDNDNDIDFYDLADFANKWLWMDELP